MGPYGKEDTFFFLTRSLPLVPTSHFRGRKNEYSAEHGWRLLANTYHSRNPWICREKTKTRNGTPYAVGWRGNLRQITTRRTALIVKGVNILRYEEEYSYGAPYKVRTNNVLPRIMRYSDVPCFIEIPRFTFWNFENYARMMRTAQQGPKQSNNRFKSALSIKSFGYSVRSYVRKKNKYVLQKCFSFTKVGLSKNPGTLRVLVVQLTNC